MHVLIANKQFLCLIDVPIQDQSQQLSFYKIFILDITHGNFTACYDINTQYLGITQDETMAVEISPQWFTICQEANGQFCTIPTPFQLLANPPSCITALYAKNTASISARCSLQIRKNLRCQYALRACTQCLDFNKSTLSSNHHNYPHMPGRNNAVHSSETTHPYIMPTHSLQCYITKFSSNPTLLRTTSGYGEPKHDKYIIYEFLHMATLGATPE